MSGISNGGQVWRIKAKDQVISPSNIAEMRFPDLTKNWPSRRQRLVWDLENQETGSQSIEATTT